MAVSIGINIHSLKAQAGLAKAAGRLANSFERLASGQRINDASDDAAGLAVSSSLRLDTRVFTQAVRNINDGVSLLNIAEGALRSLSDITIRQRELATQAATGTFSLAQRKAITAEANALVREFNRSLESTKFNNQRLLDGSGKALVIQGGYSTAGTLLLGIGDDLERTVGTGQFLPEYGPYGSLNSPSGLAIADFNRDGVPDVVVGDDYGLSGLVQPFFGALDGSLSEQDPLSNGVSSVRDLAVADFNNDGWTDFIAAEADINFSSYSLQAFANLSGSFSNMDSPMGGILLAEEPISIATGDVNGDGKADVIFGTAGNRVGVMLGNGNYSFKAPTYRTLTGPVADLEVSDVNNDGVSDIAISTSANLSVMVGNGNGSFQATRVYSGNAGGALSVADFNNDGNVDAATRSKLYIGNGDGSFQAAKVQPLGTPYLDAGDFNGDGVLDLAGISTNPDDITLKVVLGNGDGTFRVMTSSLTGEFFNAFGIAAADFQGDGIPEIITGEFGGVGSWFTTTAQATTTPLLNLFSQSAARDAVDTLDRTLDRIHNELGSLGSLQSRLSSSLNTLQSTVLNTAQAESRITSADIAEEAAASVRDGILQQMASAVLGQANQTPSLALSLLRHD